MITVGVVVVACNRAMRLQSLQGRAGERRREARFT